MEAVLAQPAAPRAERVAAALGMAWLALARAHVARALLGAAERLDHAALDRKFQERISRVTTETVMAVMDQQGIAHCALCPARAGLVKREGALLCRKCEREKK